MGFLTEVFGLKDLVLGVLDRVKLNPEKKAEIQALMEQNAHEVLKWEAELRQKELDLLGKEVEAASANIRAELQSGDRYTSRSRPTFLYMMYLVLAFNFIVLPLVQMIRGATTLVPLDLPGDLYWLFGAGYLGYATSRTLDKSGFKWNRGKRHVAHHRPLCDSLRRQPVSAPGLLLRDRLLAPAQRQGRALDFAG